jgi:hypothetical protein
MTQTIDAAIRQIVSQEISDRDPTALDALFARLEAALKRLEALLPQSPNAAPTDIEATRQSLRPARIRVLFVTPPTAYAGDATNYYLHNSHLFRCIRGAFVGVFGPSVPNGSEFLEYFRDQGCWLLHVPRELRRRPGRPVRAVVAPQTKYLAEAIKDARPELVVGVREPIGPSLAEAMQIVGMPLGKLVSLKMPRELWKDDFTQRLSRELRPPRSRSRRPSRTAPAGSPRAGRTKSVKLAKGTSL